MNSPCSVSIPGKVMLSGEYAVLYGATSVLTRVQRYLHVTETTDPPEFAYPPPVELARTIPIQELSGYEPQFGIPHVAIDRCEFQAKDAEGNLKKLGLGSSAAEAVGVVTLRFKRAGLDVERNRSAILGYAMTAHWEAQGGLGSGADVAACASAGPIEYRFFGPGKYLLTPFQAPQEQQTQMWLVWTGQPANTRELVKPFQAWIREASENRDKLFQEWMDSANTLAPLWYRSSQEELFAALDRFDSLMTHCAVEAGIPYKTDTHFELEEWARKHGGRAKPTGAGGGDLALMIGDLPKDQLEMEWIGI